MIQKNTPRCSRVVLVEPTRTIYGHMVFKFTGKAERVTTGFIERENREDGSVVVGVRISAHRRNRATGTPVR